MFPEDLLKKIRQIEIYTSRIVNQSLAGEYHSVFKGRGMEFSEVRQYRPGDDIRTIDWNVTARSGEPYVKVYVEERELTIMLIVDASGSQHFGSRGAAKADISAEISALLAFSAIKNNDKVGLIMFSDRIEKYIPPAKGKKHVLHVIRELLYFEPREKGTDISGALDFFGKVAAKTSVAFLISDFHDGPFMKPLSIAGGKHDMISVRVLDPLEKMLPRAGIIEMCGAESGEKMWIDTSNSRVRNEFASRERGKREELAKEMGRLGIDVIDIMTDQPYHVPLVKYFRKRQERLRR